MKANSRKQNLSYVPGNLWDGWAQGHGKWWWLGPDKKIYYDKNVDNTSFLTNELDKKMAFSKGNTERIK